jgi:hypothetical protein
MKVLKCYLESTAPTSAAEAMRVEAESSRLYFKARCSGNSLGLSLQEKIRGKDKFVMRTAFNKAARS